MIKANNPNLKSWIEVPDKSDFPIQNIPFGVFSLKNEQLRCGTRIGDQVIDLAMLEAEGFFSDLLSVQVFNQSTLNAFMELGKEYWSAVRQRISELFSDDNPKIRDNEALRQYLIHNLDAVQMHLPVRIGDYTDFYSSREHATNVGIMFRDPDKALLPNWLHIPVAYHGRSSSIVVSGTDIHRPKGQLLPKDADKPVFGPSKLLDFELEMAFVLGKGNELGEPISIENAEDHIFGMVIFNDLSARDIQKWEYVPLGPFLGKNFGSVISPWIVPLEALEPFRTSGPEQEPEVLPYLKLEGENTFDIHLDVSLQPNKGIENQICTSNFKYLYWNMAQQLAHHTVNGCNMNSGDMCASGTISGPAPNEFGSMLELSWGGKNTITLNDGSERKFIHDDDTIIMRAWSEKDGIRIGFGESRCKILAAK